MATCVVSGCSSPIYVESRGLCSRHYNRWRTTGTVDDGPRARLPPEARFAKSFEQRGPNECWPWIAKSKVDGYGVLSLSGRDGTKVLAHRYAWELVNGPIPDSAEYHGTVVRHKCDNRACVNPSHLELGTQADNVRDMMDRGNLKMPLLRGERHGMARFTEAQIRYIRTSLKSNADLSREFKCHSAMISAIRTRKTWKHID